MDQLDLSEAVRRDELPLSNHLRFSDLSRA